MASVKKDFGLKLEDFDFGVGSSSASASPPQPQLDSEEVDTMFYDDDTAQAAAKVGDKYTMATIAHAIYLRSGTIHNLKTHTTLDTWSGPEAIKYFNFLSGLGSARMRDRPWGLVDMAHVSELRDIPINALMMSLLKPKAVATIHYTPHTLYTQLCEFRGVTVDEMPDGAHVRAPGYPGHLVAALKGEARGGIVKGGPEYIAWHNATFKTHFDYIDVNDDVRAMALFLHVSKNVEFGLTGVSFKDWPAHKSSHQFVSLVTKGLGTSAPAAVEALTRLVADLYNDPIMRPQIGFSKDKLAYTEGLLQRGYDTMSDGDRLFFRKLHTSLRTRSENAWRGLVGSPEIVGLFGHFDEGPVQMNKERMFTFALGNARLAGVPLRAWGDVFRMVHESRTHVRDNVDMARKSDAPGVGCVMGSATSVPVKIASAIAILDQVAPGERRIDAYGTHVKNWWHNEIVSSPESDVRFFDIKKEYAPPLGGKFEMRNIEHLEPGSGRERYVYDDTYNAVDNKPMDTAAKVKSVIQADYEGGFLKLYLGSGDDAATSFRELPPSIALLKEHYNFLMLSPGSSPHSPEYFVVFARTKRPFYPTMDDKGFGWAVTEVHDQAVAAVNHMKWLRGWLVTKGMDVIYANLALNHQLLSASYVPRYRKSVLDQYLKPTYRIAGAKQGSSQVVGPKIAQPDLGKGKAPEVDDLF